MKWIDLFSFFLQGTLEMTGVIAVSLAVAGVPLRWKLIIPAGMVLAVVMFAIRHLPVPFGLHTIAALLLVVFFIAKTTTLPPTKSFIAVSVSMIILALLEIIFYESLFALTKVEPNVAVSKNTLWSLFGLPQAVIMIFLALLISRFKKPVQGAWKR